MSIVEITTFLFLIGHRGLSGLQNHYGYKRRSCFVMYFITTICMLFTARVTQMWISPASVFYVPGNTDLTKFVAIAGAIVSVIGFFGVANSFKRVTTLLPRDIHLWETIATGAFAVTAFAAGVDIIYLFLSVSPGMVLHKGLINVSTNRPFIDAQEITDDKTGATYGIPTLDLVVKRFIRNGWYRLALAILATAFVILNELYFNINFNVFTLIRWI